MTQYDAGPGDWSDREWEDPERKSRPQARRRLVLPPWALALALVTIAILVCVGVVLALRAMRGGEAPETPTVEPTVPAEAAPSPTVELIAPTEVITPTPTVVLPLPETQEPAVYTEIAPGATVVVEGTAGRGLNLRAQPTTGGRLVAGAKEGATLTVLEGPQSADGYTWWKVRTADGKEGWAAGRYLVLKP